MDIYDIVEAKLRAKGVRNGLAQGASEIAQKVDRMINNAVAEFVRDMSKEENSKLGQAMASRSHLVSKQMAPDTVQKSPGPKAAQRIERMDRLREMNMFKGRKGGPP